MILPFSKPVILNKPQIHM